MTFSDISKYRSELMGLAIVLVMLCHNSISIPFSSLDYAHNSLLKPILQIGVDIFLFLSGLGCYYSYAKNKNMFSFYKKRFSRIIPVYIVIEFVRIIELWVRHGDLIGSIYSFSPFSFWFSNYLDIWFISAILVCYLLFPFLYVVITKGNWLVLSLIICSFIILSFSCTQLFPNWLPARVFLVRLPVFFFGGITGKYAKNNKELPYFMNFPMVLLCFILFLIACILALRMQNTWSFCLCRLIFGFLAPLLCILACYFMPHVPLFSFLCVKLSPITLELYLVHTWILGYTDKIITYLPVSNKLYICVITTLSNFMSIICAIIVSFLVNKFCSLLSSLFVKTKLNTPMG